MNITHNVRLARRVEGKGRILFRGECSCGEYDPFWHGVAGIAHTWGDRHKEQHALAQEDAP